MEIMPNGFPSYSSDFTETMEFYRIKTEKKLELLCGSFCEENDRYKSLYDAAEYSLKAGGKRIRPVLTLELCRAYDGKLSDALTAAAAIEMIHTFSLIHDDLPCMDDDDMRRGRPSCHKAFSEAGALLAGDMLVAMAGKVICESSLDAIKKSEMLSCLYDCTIGMIEGQTVDISGNFTDIGGLLQMYSLKTSELLKASCVMGCIAAGADKEDILKAKEYAYNLGLAFQIVDDILDVTSTEEQLGKPVGSDEEQNKITSVTLLGIDGARALAAEFTEKAENILCEMKNSSFLLQLTDLLLKRKK